MEGSAHYDGRAVDVFVRPDQRGEPGRGWAIAHYLVAQADRLDIQHRHLRRPDLDRAAGAPATAGATTTRPDGASGDPAILEHRDHVHVDVFE